MRHEHWMKEAIREARLASDYGMRPFGCVIVTYDGIILGRGRGTESATDPTRHSEIKAIQEACDLNDGPLGRCWLYSTHEPCQMCCGAIKHAKLTGVVWGSFREDLPTLFRQNRHTAVELLTDTSHPPKIAVTMRQACVRLFDDEVLGLTPALDGGSA